MWLTNLDNVEVGPEGALYGTHREIYARFVETGVRAGLVVQRGTDPRTQVAPLAALPAAVVDDILLGPFAPAIADQLLIDVAGAPGGVLDGALGPLRVSPPRSMTATFDANVNWGLIAMGGTTCAFIGLLRGRLIEESFWLPSGGAATVESDMVFDTPISLRIGACDGAGGGAGTWGWGNARHVLTKGQFGIPAYEWAKGPSAVAALTYDAGESASIVIDGAVWCVVETTAALDVVAGDSVAVRVVLAGADVRGQITRATSPLNGNFALLEGAYFESSASAGELALVRIGG